MASGYTGKILRVDLTSGTTSVEEKDDAFYRRSLDDPESFWLEAARWSPTTC